MTPPAASHRITTDAAGTPILAKRASGPSGGARLAGEAAMLRALAHPGLVRVVDLVEAGQQTELHVAWVGPHSLATVTSVPAVEAGRVVARLAEVVADLHDRGVTHGRLTPDHVLLGADAQPVLTGLADAVGHAAGDRAADVAAMGGLLTRMVQPLQGGSMIPDVRPRRGRDAGLTGALLTVADLAAADDRDLRPSARDLAARLRAVVEPAAAHRQRRLRLPRLHRSDPAPDPMPPRPPTRLDIGPVRIERDGTDRSGPDRSRRPRPAEDRPSVLEPHPTGSTTDPTGGRAPSGPGTREGADPGRDAEPGQRRVPDDHHAPDPPAPTPSSVPPPATPPAHRTSVDGAEAHGPDRAGRRAPDHRPTAPPSRPGTGRTDARRGAGAPEVTEGARPPDRAGRRAAVPSTLSPPGAAQASAARTLSPRSTGTISDRRVARLDVAPRHRRVAVALLAGAVLASLVAAVVLRSEPSSDVAVRTRPTTTAPGRDAATATTVPAGPPTTTGVGGAEVIPLPPEHPSDGPAREACPPVAASPAADIDGDGCPDALRIDQERVTAGDTTWVVGRPGDAVVVADWNCDGTATVASLRPSTGEVFVFDRWVAAGDELTVRAATTVPGADGLRAVDDDGDGCAALTATEPDGSATTVPVRAA